MMASDVEIARIEGEAAMSAALERGCNGEPGVWPDWVYGVQRLSSTTRLIVNWIWTP
jgi:hypothetical protein